MVTPPSEVALTIERHAGLDSTRGLGASDDVERHQPSEAGVAHELDGRVRFEPARELGRVRGVALHPHAQRRQAPKQEPRGIRRSDDAEPVAESADALGVLRPAADDRAEEDVVVPAEELGRAVQREVGSVLERPEVDGRRGRRVDHERRRVGRCRLEIGQAEQGVRGRLDPDEVGAVRGRSRLVELHVVAAPTGRASPKVTPVP